MKVRKIRFGGRPGGRTLRMLYIPHGIAHGSHGLEDEIGIRCRMPTPCHIEAAAAGRDLPRPDFPLS